MAKRILPVLTVSICQAIITHSWYATRVSSHVCCESLEQYRLIEQQDLQLVQS